MKMRPTPPLAPWLAAAVSLLFTGALPAGEAEKPLRLAIVGLEHGHVSGFLTRVAARPDIELVGLVETRRDLRERDAAFYQLAPSLVFERLEDLLATRQVEAVATFTNTFDHLQVVQTCAARGVHVMVEKPLAVSLEHARAMATAARRGGIHVIVNYETSWYAGNHLAHAVINQQGAIGEIRRMVVNMGNGGRGEKASRPEFLDWLKDPVRGGGALLDFGCYGANLMTWLMQGRRPTTVAALTHRLQPEKYLQVEDDATILLQYPNAVGVIQASWNWSQGRKDMEIYGQRGSVLVPQRDTVRIQIGKTPESLPAVAPLPPELRDSLSHLRAVVRGTVAPDALSSLDLNVVVTEILDAARESARTGRAVALPAEAR